MATDLNAPYEKLKVDLSHDGKVLNIVLHAPPGNVLDAKMMSEISTCLDRQGESPHLRAIVFQGEGKHYCFGASVQEHQKKQAPQMIHGFHQLFKKLLSCRIPTISLVRGQCLGGGMELAAFCNFIIAEPGAKFGQPEIQLAVLPPVAALILPTIIGQQRADDLILTGRSIDADTAHAWGLVTTIADDGKVALDAFLEKKLLPKSAASLRYANRASRDHWYATLPARLDEMERLYVDELMESHDANEGIEAFLAKRLPEWTDN